METDSIPRQTQETIEQIDTADLVVGVFAELDQDGVTTLYEGLREIAGPFRIAVLQNNHARNPNSAPASSPVRENPGSEPTKSGGSLFFVPAVLAEPEDPSAPALSMFAAYQSVFKAGERLKAKACCVLASKLKDASPRWFCQFTQPLLEKDFDLLVPHYARHKFEGLLNSSIICPLTRSLYGKRIHNPMGPDLGISQRLFQKMLTAERVVAGGSHSLASLAPRAVCDNMKISEIHVGPRVYRPTDWTNISSLLAQVLGPVFLDMERNAPCWQRIRGSVPVPIMGKPAFVSQDNGNIDISHMVESFQLGNRELQEIWSLVLPPTTLFEMRKLARVPLEQFRIPDELWVRIVYDFALAHRLRTISRDHLLKSMTPLYLGWVASYVRDLQDTGRTGSEQRLERLSLAFESGKPYLVSRWRWPDRFSP